MKTVLVIRFGLPTVLQKETQLFNEIGGEAKAGIAAPFGGMGIMALFKTDFTPIEIAAKYSKLAEETNDTLPVIAAEPEQIGIDLSAAQYNELVAEFEKSFGEVTEQPTSNQVQECVMSLDELLDKIAAVGTKNLTESETARLQELTNNLH